MARIDAEAGALGRSRSEFLRRKFEGEATAHPRVAVTSEDWQRSVDTVAVDLKFNV